MKLDQMTCEACRADAPTVSSDQKAELLEKISGWEVTSTDNIERLEKTYTFKNFVDALDFTNAVGRIAEENAHHPALITEWGKVTVIWWSHKIKGLHQNDFILAAKTDALNRL